MTSEKTLAVLSRIGTMLSAARENSRLARDAGTRAYAEGMVFALTVVEGEIKSLVAPRHRHPQGRGESTEAGPARSPP